MEYEYFTWLVDFIDPDHLIGEYYQPVLQKLYFKDFRWKLKDDRNRALDGLEFRRRYVEDERFGVAPYNFMEAPCSCLEMLIALAKRIEYGILEPPCEENIARWFWKFMMNLGLDPDDFRVLDEDYVDMVLEKWLDRRYESNGKGNIFTTFSSNINLKIEPIWVQMHIFLNETLAF